MNAIATQAKRIFLVGLLSCMTSGGLFAGFSDSAAVAHIVVEGNELTKDYIVLREMATQVGMPLSKEMLEHDRKRIYSLQLFNRVDIEYADTDSGRIVIVVVDERWYIFPFPIVGFKHRDLKNLYYGAGVVHQNFRGRNEKIFFSFALGFDQWVQLGYQNPRLTDGDIFFRSHVSYGNVQNLSTSDELYTQTQFNTQLTLGRRYGLYTTFTAWAGYDIWRVKEPRFGRTVSSTGRDAFLSVGTRYTRDSRDLREYPTSGSMISLSASKQGFGEGSVDFYTFGYDLRTYHSLFSDVTIAGRTHGAFTGGGIIPQYRHLFFGYGERLRGHFNRILEGEHLVGGNLELRIPILKERYYDFPYAILPQFSVWRYGLYAGLFVDVGRIWYRSQPLSLRHWKSGIGGGLHFLLPYSFIIRTEYAVNIRGQGEFIIDFGVSF